MLILLLAGLLAGPSFGLAAEDTSDRPPWAGQQGKDGKPGRGNSDPGVTRGEVFGDLWIIVRDVNGEPIRYTWTWSDDGMVPLSVAEDPNGFIQPIAAAGNLEEFGGLIPLDAEGAVPESYAEYVQDVELGRLSIVRSPQEVVDSAYAEAMATINAAGGIGLDPAGRILLYNVELGSETLATKTIDAPLENVALYQALMKNGHLPGLTLDSQVLGSLSHLRGSGVESLDQHDLNRAASFLAAGADKTGTITLDVVIYTNTFLGINTVANGVVTGYFPFVEEPDPTGEVAGYTYSRYDTYVDGKARLLVGPDSTTVPGRTVFYLEDEVFFYDSGNYHKIFGDSDYAEDLLGARAFALAADDSLKVIEFIHNWAVPAYTE